MTDFINSVLTSMSTKFNEETENININLADDKTLKWRGLLNNKYASNRRKDSLQKSMDDERDTDDDRNSTIGSGPASSSPTISLTTSTIGTISPITAAAAAGGGGAAATAAFAAPTIGGISASDLVPAAQPNVVDNASAIVDADKIEVNNRGADKKPKRVLRRKKLEESEKKMVPKRFRRQKRKICAKPKDGSVGTAGIIGNTTVADEQKVKRLGRPRKQKTIDNSSPSNKPNIDEVKPKKLRRSERTQSIVSDQEIREKIYQNDNRDSQTKSDTSKLHLLNASVSAIETETLNIPKEEKVSDTDTENEKIETIFDNALITKTENDIGTVDESKAETCVQLESIISDDTEEQKPDVSTLIDEYSACALTIVNETPIQLKQIDVKPNIEQDTSVTNETVPAAIEQHAPKKRGRKPGTKLKPKIDKEDGASVPVKKSLRLSKDGGDSVLASAMARREKINEQIAPPQRLSRRIKPTAKILANDELRYGFELQNNARLSVNIDQLEQTPEQCPKEQNDSDVKLEINSCKSEQYDIMPIDSHKSTLNALKDVKRSIFPKDSITIKAPRKLSTIVDGTESFRLPPPRRPCPDPVDFLNEIKMAKINLHRSPEDNKKLNFKQKRRLIKLKEKHLNKLGLQKTNKSYNDSSMESSESDDVEEFVPNKKVNVGRPNVTLRLRGQRELTASTSNSTSSTSDFSLKRKKHISQTETKHMKHIRDTKESNKNNTRNYENSLLLSTKHKNAIDQQYTSMQASPSVRVKLEESLPTICLCNKSSKYYTQKTPETTYCRAIDEIETKHIGCTNEVPGDLLSLYRPSVRVSYMILCDDHKKRLNSHNCCAGCGIFCTQGNFIVCSQKHAFHRNCATKFILNAPFNPKNPDYSFPTLVLKCPHCGEDAPEQENFIRMSCRTLPVFVPNQRGNLKLARMSIDLNGIRELSKVKTYVVELEKLIPESVLELVTKAQNNFPFSRNMIYTTKDIFYAIHKNDIDRVAEIIASGFDITIPLPEYQNGTCLHLVSNTGNIQMTYLILSRSQSIDFLNVVDKELRSAIMCAIVANRNEILKLLIQCGADVTLKDPDGMTALHLAAKTGNIQAAQIILNNFRNTASVHKYEQFINATDNGGWTAMVWAAEVGNSELVTYLVNCGSEPNIRDTENNTAVHWAAMSNDIETVIPLLQDDCDLNAQNVNGDTALHISCRNSNTRLCLMLLVRGASLDVKNAAGELPYDCIPNENSACARAILFNLKLRKMARFGERTILCQDISNGRELYPIKIVKNIQPKSEDICEIDECPLPDFKYITKTILLQNLIQIDRRISQMRICSCSDNCTSQSCQCSEISVQNWYNSDGRLNGNFNYRDPAMIFECNDVCGCNKLQCKNRVVQNGTKVRMQIVECSQKAKGWGVITLTKILKGTFVAEYTGEILTDVEADRRTDDSYFFDLGASDHCIDANYYGNVSRFFNHSCDPNIVPIRVYFEHQDLRFPKIAFFASSDIDVGEEITFDYGEKFWLIKYKSFTCQCSVQTCRFSEKTIHKTLDEYNQRLARPSN